MVKASTMDRAHKAIDLMKEKNMSMKQAAKSAHIDMRTLKRAMKKLAIPRRKVKGRYRLAEAVSKSKIDGVIMWMMAGLSASAACAMSHTKVRTMARTAVVVDSGKSRRVLAWNKHKKRWVLNVCRVAFHSVVFYGHIECDPNPASPEPAYRTVRHRIGNGDNLRSNDTNDDAYANIMWQCDFNQFATVVSPDMIPGIYTVPFGRFIKREESRLNQLLAKYKLGLHFDRKVLCGVDERFVKGAKTEYYVAPKRCRSGMATSAGKFAVIIRVRGASYTYPKSNEDQIILNFRHRLSGVAVLAKLRGAK